MHSSFDPGANPIPWCLFSLGLAVLSARLALAWAQRAAGATRPVAFAALAAAGLSLGSGAWSASVVAALSQPGALSADHGAARQFAFWATAGVAAALALGASTFRRAGAAGWALAACLLGTVLTWLAWLAASSGSVVGVGIGAGWRELVTGRGADLAALAWAGGVAGCVLAFALCRRLVATDLRQMARGHWLAALMLGAALVGAAQLLQVAAHVSPHAAPKSLPSPLPLSPSAPFRSAVPAIPGGAVLPGPLLASLATLGVAALLLGLQALYRRQARALIQKSKAKREQGARSLNDPLTRLPGRALFEGTLEQAVRQADASGQSLALLFINIDDFGVINQGFGHEAGDRVLRKLGARLHGLAQAHMAARLAGDEFMLLLTGNPTREAAGALAAKVLAAAARPFELAGCDLSVTCSIGVAMYPMHGAKSLLIGHAAAAMRVAKAAGGASHTVFEAHMVDGARDQMALLRDLRLALDKRQFEIFYQPKVHGPSGEITGAEALLRWHHPQRGIVSPSVFMPLVERHGLINALGAWVIDEACRQAREWRDSGLRMRVAINLSVMQLRQKDLALQIRATLHKHQINPELITCEITESMAMDNTEVTTQVMGELHQIGVHISIDDFGTGHSSLAYLRKLAADELKIDRSFVQDLESSADARKVVKAVVNLAKALDIKVVAEGVETEAQYHLLRDFGCDQLQGYLFAKPMSASALAKWAIDDIGPRTMMFRASLFAPTRQQVPA